MILPDRLLTIARGGGLRTRPPGPAALARGYSFSDGITGWPSFTGFGVPTDDTTYVRHAHQSGRVTVDDPGNQHRYKHDLFPATNMAGDVWWELSMYVQAPAATFHGLYLFSNNNAGQYGIIDLHSGTAMATGWYTLFGRLSLSSNVGLDLTAVTGVGVQFTNGVESGFVVYDQLTFHRSAGPPQFAFTIDDGLTHADKISRIVNGYGWPVHHGIISALVGTSGSLTRAGLDAEYARGNSIGSHSMHHRAGPRNWAAAAVGVQEALDEAVGAKQRLLDWGYERGSDIFVVPYGLGSGATEVSQAKLDAIAPYFRSVVNTNPPLHPTVRGRYQNGSNQDFPSPLLPSQRRLASRMLQDNDGTFPFNATAVDRVIRAGGTGIIMLHQLDTGGVYHTTASFLTALDALRVRAQAGACVVRPLHEIVDP